MKSSTAGCEFIVEKYALSMADVLLHFIWAEAEIYKNNQMFLYASKCSGEILRAFLPK